MLKADQQDRRANRFRWAVAIVPVLGLCCGLIALLVVLGLVEVGFYTLSGHGRLFAIR